jgi:hypothetical protein
MEEVIISHAIGSFKIILVPNRVGVKLECYALT